MTAERDVIRPKVSVDHQIAALAAGQLSLVTTAQLAGLGLGRRAVSHRVRAGRLFPRHRGVFSLTPVVTFEDQCMAALLAVGRDAVLTGVTLAHMLEVGRWEPADIDIVVPRRHHGFHGVTVSESRTLGVGDIVQRGPLRTATVPRMLVDMSTTHTKWQLASVLQEAAYRRRLHMGTLRGCMARNERRPGCAVLRNALDLYLGGCPGTRSELEDAWLAQVVSEGWPEPLVNMPHHGYELDCYWPKARLNVEVDGRSGHARPSERAKDRGRDDHLRRLGLQVIRLQYREIHDGTALRRVGHELERRGLRV